VQGTEKRERSFLSPLAEHYFTTVIKAPSGQEFRERFRNCLLCGLCESYAQALVQKVAGVGIAAQRH
jgi:hypothetical protein